MRRKPGQASVEEHPKGSGRHRIRVRKAGKISTLASGLPREEALELADAYQAIGAESDLREGLTLAQFGPGFLARRARSGIRAVAHDRSQWQLHVANDPIGALPLSTLERRDVLDWLDRKTHLAHRTRQKLRNLLNVALVEAVDRGLLKANPAREVKAHRSGAARATDDLDGILQPEEQRALIAAIPGERDRALVTFALCTGLRQAEQWHLQRADVGADRVVVRRSTGGLPPKSGKPRVVHLLAPAVAALSVGPRGNVVFPAPKGGRRQEGKAPRQWAAWVRAAGITRRVRWHDLRHTCATSLLAGWWGRKWTLDEVCELLGHSSVSVTERYARKLSQTTALAVAATPMREFPGGDSGGSKVTLLSKVLGETNGLPKAKVASSILAGGAAGSAIGLGTHGEPEGELFLAALAEQVERAQAAELLSAPPRVHMVTVVRRGRKGRRDAS